MKYTYLALFSILTITLSATAAQRLTREQRQQQEQQEAQQAFQTAENYLNEWLAAIPKGITPDTTSISQVDVALKSNRSKMRYLPKEDQAKASLLTAWSEYYTNNIQRAVISASKAYRANPNNPDAYATYCIFSMLDDKRPTAKIEKTQPLIQVQQQTNDPRRPNLQRTNTDTDYATETSGNIQYSVDPRAVSIYGKPLPNSISGITFDKSKINCILFWNMGSPDTRLITPNLSPTQINEILEEYYTAQTPIVSTELKNFQLLANADQTKGKLTFTTINTDPQQLKERSQKLLDEIETKNVIHYKLDTYTDNDIVIRTLLTCTEPTMLIVAGEIPVIKYIGTTTGIAPIMLLNNISPDSINFEKAVNPTNTPTATIAQTPIPANNAKAQGAKPLNPREAMKQKQANKKPVTSPRDNINKPVETPAQPPARIEEPKNDGEPNSPDTNKPEPATTPQPEETKTPSDPNQPTKASAKKTETPKPAPKMQDEDELKASKLIQLAQADQAYIKTRTSTGKKLVEACREVLRTYPDTEYATQAKELLNSLPERLKEKYDVTKEETK